MDASALDPVANATAQGVGRGSAVVYELKLNEALVYRATMSYVLRIELSAETTWPRRDERA